MEREARQQLPTRVDCWPAWQSFSEWSETRGRCNWPCLLQSRSREPLPSSFPQALSVCLRARRHSACNRLLADRLRSGRKIGHSLGKRPSSCPYLTSWTIVFWRCSVEKTRASHLIDLRCEHLPPMWRNFSRTSASLFANQERRRCLPQLRLLSKQTQ